MPDRGCLTLRLQRAAICLVSRSLEKAIRRPSAVARTVRKAPVEGIKMTNGLQTETSV